MGETNQEPVFRDYSGFLRDRYGETLHRVPLDLGLSCPNRRADGAGGCTYCAARPGPPPPPLAEQIERGIRSARERYKATAFMAYFQAFTSTHAPAAALRPLFEEAMAGGAFRAVTVATRPDCLPGETLDLLSELAEHHDLWVELGIQTLHDRTLTAIRRGHDAACAEQAVRALSERGIPVVPHLILGLPGEGMDHYRETARRLAGWPCTGVKIHNLHIVAGSELAQAWKAGLIRLLDEHEYAAALIEVLRRLPPNWPILRLASDTPRDRLLAPRWWFGKAQFRQYVERRMQEQGWRQGDLLTPKPKTPTAPPPGKTQPLRQPKPAPDLDLGKPFAAAVRLPRPAPGRSFSVLDLGFGLGNLLLGLIPILFERVTANPLRVVALGWDRSLVDALRRRHPEYDHQLAVLTAGCARHGKQGAAMVHWGDPRRNLFRLRGQAELIILEPRAIEPNVALFTQDFLRRVTRLLVPGGVLLAASDHPALRGTLHRIGLNLGCTETRLLPDGGTVAAWRPESVLHPLAPTQLRTCTDTLAGVPYRDRSLTWSRERILGHRAAVLARLYRKPENP